MESLVAAPASIRRKIIIDTDCGTDDAQAILLALAEPTVDVIALTCVGGNTVLDNVCKNTAKVLTVTDRRDVLVYRGCAAPLIGNAESANFYHGHDGLGDCDPHVYPDVEVRLQPEPAAVGLINLAKRYPKECTLVCLGPLTNVALAMKLDAEFTQNLKELVIMGGNHEGQGNHSASGEFNFYYDPEAASIVLSGAECPVTTVGWEVCLMPENQFKSEWLDKFYNTNEQPTPQGHFLHRIHERVIEYLRSKHVENPENMAMTMCDEWAVAVCIDPSICRRSQIWPTRVELSGKYTRGQCVVDKRNYCLPAEGKRNVRHVLSLDIEKMKERLITMSQLKAFPRPFKSSE
ncbi:nucleoside hydrolase-like [Paramacrobiotus metropolitanus]|uniref:nucleoside hydrolase-like n=1 Tax=Paramacrobiotus metropolitanus TaxID=2943436 RepID=UPI0024463000|nr:nucleoside hydrolase-like [Paramacrobiotus metropolitanus]